MGVVRIEKHGETPMKRRVPREKDDEGFACRVKGLWAEATGKKGIPIEETNGRLAEEKRQRLQVCVTSGVSYIGWHIAHRLSRRGYNVRLIVSVDGLSAVRSALL